MTQDSKSEKTSKPAPATGFNYDENKAQGIKTALNRPIVLIGMMGSGKSRVGHLLAQALDLPYADCDRAIEDACGCSIADYFSRYGEDAFRDGETRVLGRLLEGPLKIISAGGGFVVRAENRDLLKKQAIAVWLQADIAVLAARCAGSDRRPLLNNADPRQVLADLLAKRRAWYEDAAAITASSNHDDANETVVEVLDALALYLKVP